MREKYKYALTALAVAVAVVWLCASVCRNHPEDFEDRFAESFSRILEQLSDDPNYICTADQNAHVGFRIDRPGTNRLGGLDPNSPMLDDRDLGPLHVTLAVMRMSEFNILGRVISKLKLPPGHPLRPKQSALVAEGKVIVVAAANPTVTEMTMLAEKLKALRIDFDIPITLFPNGYVDYGRNISYVGG